ncbi:MAG: cytochrome c3 family protein [Cyanobacteria bacterium SBLK]|nr:cytochrome c3 family protein [Cyanobacteria bacterium SBLK]
MSDRIKKLFVFVLSIGFLGWSLLLFPLTARADGLSEKHIEEISNLWQKSAHAFADVNCSSCHLEPETKQLIIAPNHESCQSCHERQVETFLLGKHGIRLQEGLSPLTPAMAHLPMKEAASDRQMNCNTCHDVHSVNTFTASVNSCLTCHNDTHSLNYVKSKHGLLFTEAKLLPAPTADLVSCATCHLPRQRVEGTKTVFVNHNNTYNLLPRDRMVKDVCMNCHGMEYSYNSIFDDELVKANFDAPPTQYLETLEMVKAFEKKRGGTED